MALLHILQCLYNPLHLLDSLKNLHNIPKNAIVNVSHKRKNFGIFLKKNVAITEPSTEPKQTLGIAHATGECDKGS